MRKYQWNHFARLRPISTVLASLIGAIFAGGCGSPSTAIDPEPPQLFSAPRVARWNVAGSAGPALDRRVLFIGNSYTQAGNQPELVQRLGAASRRVHITSESSLLGGATLEVHYIRPGVLETIRDGHFTHVVLQGQALEPIAQTDSFRRFAGLFAEAIHAAGAIPVFFETWARPAGDPVYQDPAYGGDPRGMQAILRDAYQRAADENGGHYAPVGDAWEMLLGEPSPPSMYADDAAHPTAPGIYLDACVLFDVVSGLRVLGNEELYIEVDRALGTRLQRVADRVVLGD